MVGFVPCTYCGTPFQPQVLDSVIRCPSCGAPLQVLPDGAVVAVREPEPEVDPEIAAALAEIEAGSAGSERSHGLPSGLILLVSPVLYAVWVLAIRALFELEVGVPLPLDDGQVWMALLVVAPLVSGMMVGIAVALVALVLHWLRATRRPSLAMALIAAVAAALMLATDHAYQADSLREAGDAIWSGTLTWAMATLIGPLNQMAMQSAFLLLAVFLSVDGLLAAVVDLVRRRSSFGCSGFFAAGLHAVALAAVLGCLGAQGARLWDDVAVASTLHTLRGGEPAERIAAAVRLEEIGDHRVLRDLGAIALEDEDRTVRLAAVHTLSVLGDRRVADALLPLLEDPDRDLVRAAAAALSSMLERLDLGDSSRRAWARAARDLLEHDDDAARAAGADILIALGPTSESYATELLSTEGDTRTQALRVLEAVGEDECIGHLLWYLDDPAVKPVLVAASRRGGAGTLVRSAWAGAAPAWHRIDDDVHDVLVEIGPPGVDSLVEATCDDDFRSDGRAYAWVMARELGGDAAADRATECVVASFASDDNRTRERARYTLGRIGWPAVGGVVTRLDTLSPEGRAEAARALRSMTGQRLGEDPAAWTAWWSRRQGR